jgi:DNA polymerase elongation subunit (family B)
MTVAGAEPVDMRSKAALDYGHYIEHQILPIAMSIADAVGFDARSWLDIRSQIELDFDS